MNLESWPSRVLAHTYLAIDLVNRYFLRQIENKHPVCFGIKTDLPLFNILLFKQALDELVYKGTKKEDIKSALLNHKRYSKSNIDLWNIRLSKTDKVRNLPRRISWKSVPNDIFTIEIKEELQEIVIIENAIFNPEEGRLYTNYSLAIFCKNVLNLIWDLDTPGYNLSKLFVNDEAFAKCLGLFEYCEVTLFGKADLKRGRAGKLIGVIQAIRETPNMFIRNYTNEQLLDHFNHHFNTSYRTYDVRSKGYKQSYDDAITFLQPNRKKKK